jgi:predicted MFS family arabinose efflux permease
MIPASKVFLNAYGWSTALILIAVCSFVVAPLAAALAGRAPRPATPEADQTLGEALAEAWRTPSYQLLTGGFFVCGFHVVFISTHLPAYLTDMGQSADLGAWALATIGLFNIFGAYFSGVLGMRYSKKRMLSFIYAARALAFAVFILVPTTPATVLIFSAVLGILWLSTVPPTSALVAQIFGPRYMGTLFGIVFFSHQLGSFFGAWLGGVLYDAAGSYDVVWWLSVALGVASALIHWPIDERPLRRLAPAG